MRSNLDISINQGVFIQKIEAYLRGRGRKNIAPKQLKEDSIEGLCNGAVLYLFEKLFYDALNRYYQQPELTTNTISDTTISKKFLDVMLEEAFDEYFNEVEAIVNTKTELLESPILNAKLSFQKTKGYTNAKIKLDNAIHSGKLVIPKEIKDKSRTQFGMLYVSDGEKKALPQETSDYHSTLIDLAEDQNIITNWEANMLRNEAIPDIPLFEKFINNIFILQINNKDFATTIQHDLPTKFSLLHSNANINTSSNDNSHTMAELPKPILDYTNSFMVTPEELMVGLNKILPDERLVLINLPQHTTGVFKTNGQYFFYDSNNPKKEFARCHNPIMLVLKLSLSILGLAANKMKSTPEEITKVLNDYNDFLTNYNPPDSITYISQTREWFAAKNAPRVQAMMLEKAINKLEEEYNRRMNAGEVVDDEVKTNLITNALITLPQTLGFSWHAFKHPNSPQHQYPKHIQKPDNDRFKEIIEEADFAGETLLMKLAEHGQYEQLEQVLIQMKDPINKISEIEYRKLLNKTDKNGNTALYAAIISNNIDMVDLLLKYGADIRANSRISNFMLCCTNNICDEIFEKILPTADVNEEYIDQPALFVCILRNNLKRVERLLQQGANPNANIPKDSFAAPSTVLEYALITKNLPMIDLLLKYGADVQTRVHFNIMTCLFHEARQGNTESVKLLLKYGAKLDKDEKDLIKKHDLDPIIAAYLQFPDMTKRETMSQQLGFLFHNYANPPTLGGFFPTTFRHYESISDKISKELQKPENTKIDNQKITEIIEKFLDEVGGYTKLRNGEFKKRIDLVFKHFLKTDITLAPAADKNQKKLK